MRDSPRPAKGAPGFCVSRVTQAAPSCDASSVHCRGSSRGRSGAAVSVYEVTAAARGRSACQTTARVAPSTRQTVAGSRSAQREMPRCFDPVPVPDPSECPLGDDRYTEPTAPSSTPASPISLTWKWLTPASGTKSNR